MPTPSIVSLVPSLTEFVWALGCGQSLVARTRFCVEPRGAVEAIPTIGGTKDPDVQAIVSLAPGLVIANREENRREDVEALRAAGLEVLVTDPNTVDEALTMMTSLGRRLGRAAEAHAMVEAALKALAEPLPLPSPRVFVAVWRRPLLGLGSDAYGHDLLLRAGASNVLAGRPRYPETTLDEVRALRPRVILLPDEPFRFTNRHVPPFAAIAPTCLIDGKLLWWYGPRLPDAVRTLRALFAAAGGGR